MSRAESMVVLISLEVGLERIVIVAVGVNRIFLSELCGNRALRCSYSFPGGCMRGLGYMRGMQELLSKDKVYRLLGLSRLRCRCRLASRHWACAERKGMIPR